MLIRQPCHFSLQKYMLLLLDAYSPASVPYFCFHCWFIFLWADRGEMQEDARQEGSVVCTDWVGWGHRVRQINKMMNAFALVFLVNGSPVVYKLLG